MLHFVALIAVMWVLSRFDIMQFPDDKKVHHWDAGWYYSIVKEGYQYQRDAQCNLAFFPLFPFVWKWTGLSNIGISILNCIFLIIGIIMLSEIFRFGAKEILYFVTTPSLMFCFVPYSEALFFLSAALLLAGLKRQDHWLSASGIFIAGLTRSVSLVFFAAISFTAFISWFNDKNSWKQYLKSLVIHFSASIGSVLCVAYIQWKHTGLWFYFLQTQKYWGKAWGLPKFPLITWGGSSLIWMDGAALFIGLTATAFCFFILYKTIIAPENRPSHSAFNFSVAYLALIALITLFYGISKENTFIYSINRYVFATPFFTIFIFGLKEKKQWRDFSNRSSFILIPLLLLAFGMISMLMQAEWIEVAGITGFAALSVFYLLATNEKIFGRYFFIFYVAHVIMQLKLFDLFLNGRWVG